MLNRMSLMNWRPPMANPAIDWSFLTSLPDGAALSRAQNGNEVTYIGSDGLVHYAAANEPRFEYDPVTFAPLGLLREDQATNKLTRSWRISAWANNFATSVNDNVVVSPDGTLNASEIAASMTLRGRYLSVSGLTAGAYYAVSGYFKATSGGTNWKIGAESTEDVASNGHINLSSVTGLITSYGTKTYGRYSVLLPNGWVYFRYYVKTGAAQTSFAFIAYSNSGASTASIWGAQVEDVNAKRVMRASSYIPTDGSVVTRAADMLYAPSIPWYNPNEGTIVIDSDIYTQSNAVAATLVEFGDGTLNNRINLQNRTDAQMQIASVVAASTALFLVDSAAPWYSGRSVAVARYKSAAMYVNHTSANAGADGSDFALPIGVNVLYLGSRVDGTQPFTGHIRKFEYYNTGKSNDFINARVNK